MKPDLTEMSDKIGVSKTAVVNCEQRKVIGITSPNQAKINDFIINYGIDVPEYDDFVREKHRKALTHHFKEGQGYCIYTSTHLGGFGGISWEKDCTFIYLRKEGKHHFFRELNGGWLRTYTDAQLIGKKIVEVNS